MKVDDTWNIVIQVDRDGKFLRKYQTIVQERNILFDEYLDNLIDKEDYEESKWSLCQDDDRLLGLFAFKYDKTSQTSQGEAERSDAKLSGPDIPIKIMIVNRGIVKKTKTLDFSTADGLESILNFNVSGQTGKDDYKRKYLDFCAKSGYLPTLFFIQSDRLTKLKPHKIENQTRQTLFTQNFLVIKHGLQIIYGKLDSIFKVNMAALKELELGKLIDTSFFRKKLESNDMLLYFKTIDLSVLQDSLTERDFKISHVATIDPQGFMAITDRAKDVIKSGGEWISSIEVENVATDHPKVSEAAVIGHFHPKWSERPLACVVLKPGKVPQPEAFAAHLLQNGFAKWQVPDDVAFVDAIPLGATGKMQKMKLREQFKDHRLPTA